MKVRKSAANERGNERTSERKNDIIKAFVWKRTTKYVEKVQRTSAITAISGIFPVFSAGKKFYQKSDSAMLWALLMRIFMEKSEKTSDEILRKCQKTGFSGIFRAFSAGNDFFPEIGLCHILGITILHLCAKNQQKLMSQSREKLV